MLSKQQSKLISSLKIKKYRNAHQLFVVEGKKVVSELLNAEFEVENIVISEQYATKNTQLPEGITSISIIGDTDFKKISSQHNPDGILAVAKMPQPELPNFSQNPQWTLVLDHLQDPGNLGTIIRIADWFGIKHVLCSTDCVDLYNHKTIQATMGSFTRVNTHYIELDTLLSKTSTPLYATTMVGENIHTLSALNPGFILIGNEANGIQDAYLSMSTKRISIPKIGSGESLNAAVATGIVVSHLLK